MWIVGLNDAKKNYAFAINIDYILIIITLLQSLK